MPLKAKRKISKIGIGASESRRICQLFCRVAMAEQQRQEHAFPWLNLIVTEPFYAFHGLTFFSYLVIRQTASQWISEEFGRHLLRREVQALLTFGVLAAIKFVKNKTWEAFIADSLLYAKGFLIMLASILDRYLAIWYTVIFLVIFLLWQQPPYNGPGNVQHMTPLQLETILTEGNNSKLWLVEFRALWSSRCIQSSRCFSELSMIYSTENLSFGLVDLSRFPNAAAKFGIAMDVSMGQLPTYILFEGAAEVCRFPQLDFEGKSSVPTITKGLLAQHFELDRRLIQCISSNLSHGRVEATRFY